MNVAIDFSDDVIEQIAKRAAELVIEQQSASAMELVDATTLAQQLGVSRDTVYARADEFGGRRIGNGKRPRLRFNVADALAAWQPTTEQEPPLRAPRRRKSTNRHGLLPVVDQTRSENR